MQYTHSGLNALILSRSNDTFIIVVAVNIRRKLDDRLTPRPRVLSLIIFNSSRSRYSEPKSRMLEYKNAKAE